MSKSAAATPLKIALVGCGRISPNHFQAIAAHKESAKLTAVCDIDPEALSRAQQQTGATGYRSLGELLDKSDAQVVVLSTPSGLHASQALQVAKSGRHVITEKPMATRWEDGKAMVQGCDQAEIGRAHV